MNADKTLNDAIETLKGKLEDLERDLRGKIDTLNGTVTDLQNGKANAQDVTDKVTRLEGLIKAAKDVADAAVTVDGLNAAIDGLKNELKAADAEIEATYIKIETWDKTTGVVVEKLVTLETAYSGFQGETFYAGLSDDVKAKVLAIYSEAKVRLYRAVTEEAATKIGDDVIATFNAIEYVNDTFNDYVPEHYYVNEWNAMNGYLAAAYEQIVALEFGAADFSQKVDGIREELAGKLDGELTKAEVLYNKLTDNGTNTEDKINAVVTLTDAWNELLTSVEYTINDEGDLADSWKELNDVKVLYNNFKDRYDALAIRKSEAKIINDRVETLAAALDAVNSYNATNKAEYESIMAAITDWDDKVGVANTDNTEMIARGNVVALTAEYNGLVDAYIADANALLDRLDAKNDGYTYVFSAWAEVNTLYADANAWLENVTVVRGFAVNVADSLEKSVNDAITTYTNGIYARATALKAAKNEAQNEVDGINVLIENLTADINAMTKITKSYQTRYNAIVEAVKLWDDTYFAEDGDYASEAVIGDYNYDLLNHEAYNALGTLYNEKIGSVMSQASYVIEKFENIKLENITVMSKKDLDAANEVLVEFLKCLGDLAYEIDGIGTTESLKNTYAAAETKYNNLCKTAEEEYAGLKTDLRYDTVTVYEGDLVADLVGWYDKYFGTDLYTNDDAEFPDGEYTFTEKLQEAVDAFEDVKATQKAYKVLRVAKNDELTVLQKAADKLLENLDTPSTKLRSEITIVQELFAAWKDGSNVPTTGNYNAKQFKGNADDIGGTREVDVAALSVKVETLEEARDTLFGRITNDLGKTYVDLTDEAVRNAYAGTIATLKADIKDFVENQNQNHNEFVDVYQDAIDNADLAVAQAEAIATLNDDRNSKYAYDNDETDTTVKDALDCVLANAVANIVVVTIEDEFVTDITAYVTTAMTDLDNVYDTANAYQDVFNAANAITVDGAGSVKADLIKRAAGFRKNAIDYVLAEKNTTGDAYKLADNSIELLRYTITKFNAYALVDDKAVASYGLLSQVWGDAPLADAEDTTLVDAKGLVDSFFQIH